MEEKEQDFPFPSVTGRKNGKFSPVATLGNSDHETIQSSPILKEMESQVESRAVDELCSTSG